MQTDERQVGRHSQTINYERRKMNPGARIPRQVAAAIRTYYRVRAITAYVEARLVRVESSRASRAA